MRRGLGHPEHPSAVPATAPASTAPVASSASSRGGAGGAKRADGADVLTVGELTRTIRTLLEVRVGTVSVKGETAGLKASPSGHVYFSLKDSSALVDCVIWRSAAERIRQLPADGTNVTVRGKLTVYEPRGRYQLVVTSIAADTGKGELWRRFEELKERLAAEGLFDHTRKRTLPDAPGTIGIVTSVGGAALRDILKILSRRAPNVRVVVSPSPVQGEGAAEEIARALARLDAWGGMDVVIVGRGGGSLEDLWAFNEEPVARAIARMSVPVVSAVGHETDFTIADFVADARAATPSEAAERIAPDRSHLRGRMAHAATVLSRALSGAVRERREMFRGVVRRRAYRRPEELFAPRWQRLDELTARFAAAAAETLRRAAGRRDIAEARLRGMSPLAVLERGYAVVLDANGRAVTDAGTVTEGDLVTARLHRGILRARAESHEE